MDHVFFTGSPAVGRTVMAKAATHLASVTLELGGNCPAIVDKSADLDAAVTHIAGGKHQNAGQICLSPDHVWVHEDLHDEFVERYLGWVSIHLYDNLRIKADRLGRIVNARNVDRINGYLDDALERGATVRRTGKSESQQLIVEPAVVTGVDTEASIMREEIFGPILPVIRYHDVATVIDTVREQSKPLALYVFSADDEFVEQVVGSTSSGGVTVNGWALHSSDPGLPFGGVGGSGMGRYHGVHGFRERSYARAVFVAARR